MCIFFHSASGFCDSPCCLRQWYLKLLLEVQVCLLHGEQQGGESGPREGWGGLSCDPAEPELLRLGVNREG